MKRLVFALVSVFFVLATILTISYAWFINSDFEDPDVSGYSYAAYFASGNGSEENPYTITNKRHLYNLAWLQFLGEFNEYEVNGETKTLTNQYYFQISPDIKEIDMSNYPLPPIGTEENPFVGVFKGNGCVIKNLTVSNDITEFGTNLPKAEAVNKTNIEELNIIGMFGVVGNYNTMYNVSSYVPSIQNFYLDDVTISSIAKQALVGLVAGYVGPSGNITNIGVHYSKFKLANGVSKISDFDNISNYALIGDYDSENVGWEDKPSAGGSGGQGDDLAYGGNFDVDKFFQRMALIYANKTSDTPSPYLPNMSGDDTLETGNKVPLTVANPITSEFYSGAEAKELVSSQNIGYATGNQNKSRDITIKWGDTLIAPSDMMNGQYTNADGETPAESKTVPRQLFKIIGTNGNHGAQQIKPLTDEEFLNMPQGIQDLIPDSNESVKKRFLRLQQRYSGSINFTNTDQNEAWAYLGQVNYYGKTYGEDVEIYNTAGIALPNNAIWFKPKNAGTVRIVMYSADNGKSFRITKVKRASATLDNPFNGTDLSDVTSSDSSIGSLNEYAKNLPSYLMCYFEFEISQAEIEAGNIEYIITQGDGGGAYFYYLDIGISGNNGEGGGETPDTPTYTGSLSSIDFVGAIGSTLDNVSASGYVFSDVLFAVSNVENADASTADVVFYFRRKKFSSGDYTDVVLYYIDPRTLDSNGNPTNESNGLKLTSSSTGSKTHASSTKCNNYIGGASNDEEIISSTTTAYNNLNDAVSAGTITNNAESLALINSLESWLSDWESLDDTSSASITTAQISELLTIANNQYDAAQIKSLIDLVKNDLTTQTITTTDETNITNAYIALSNASTAVKSLVGDSYISKCNSLYELLQNAYVTVTFHVEENTTQIKLLSSSTLSESKAPVIDTELYEFNGWYTDSTFNNAYTFGNAVGNQSIDLYAKVSQKTIVVFKLNGEEISRVTKPSGFALEDSDFPSIDSNKYYFNGWFDELGNEYTTGSIVNGNVILSADIDNKYSVTFVYNNGSSNTFTYADKNGIISDPIDPTHINPIATFAGWYTNEALTQEFSFTSSISSNITLYAKWTYDAEVVFNLNGGSISGSTNDVVIAVNSTTGIPVLPNEGSMSNGDLSFEGWYLDAECETPFDSTTSVTSPTTTVYANWIEEASVTVYFKIGYRFNNDGEREAKYLSIPVIESDGTMLVDLDVIKKYVLEHANQNESDWKIGVLYETWFSNEIDLSTATNTYMTNGYLDLSKLGVEGSDTIDGQSGSVFYYVTINFVNA